MLHKLFSSLRGKSLIAEAALVEIRFVVDDCEVMDISEVIHEEIAEIKGFWAF
jgi:hypothetical protein